ncbi:MAG: helix-turn-helix domain-containing protein [Aliifodinibius sp.]|nr:helix-turn-helix transcriptional regulator [candidate division Zixibacteria bacterium]NIT60504.1 helix-turn-helix transcriptional regulator [Fodinibius sp.]NIW48174.1 helix-turn-helix domain-containing protein [Gammaproteobacteria bacterium]NIS48218.1 helix-turn-helix transcriptional regulator [candidate division Zixibacteria bacterium]NIU16340.1 helix-turn-helix transcriptional regulator [candidate division Zixibacteria bacterium]
MTEKYLLQEERACVEKVKKLIRDNIDSPLPRTELAGVAGYSVSHFHRIFTGQTGDSIAGYVRKVRLKRAGYKLRLGAVDITQVALAAGYESHAAFSKAFKQQHGLSASEFRELRCGEATALLMKGSL